MSQSPVEAGEQAPAYHTGWTAVSRLLRRGFSWSGNERDVVYANRGSWSAGRGGFVDVSAPAGLDLSHDGRAAAPLDWDFDGDLDLVVSARSAPRLRVLRNDQGTENGWLAVQLVGLGTNKDGIGARVEVTLEGGSRERVAQTRRAGEGFLAQAGTWLHLGLGEGRPTGLRVRWADGEWEAFGVPRAGRHLVLVQGSGAARSWPAPSAPAPLAAGAPEAPAPGAPVRVVPRQPVPMPTLTARTGPGEADRGVRFFGVAPGARGKGTGRPVLITLFSHTCAPCAGELGGLARARVELDAAGLDLLALSVDPVEESAQVAAFLERTGFHGTPGRATPETLAILDALHSALLDTDAHLPVPASFLVDAGGSLQALYVGAAEAETVLRDLSLASLGLGRGRELAAQALPGRLLTAGDPDPLADLEWLEQQLRRRGLPGVAGEVAQGKIDARTLDEAKMQLEFGKARLQQGQLDVAQRHFEAAVKLDPNAGEAWRGIGYCLHRARDYAGARDAYLQALRLDPSDETNRFNLGLAYHSLGDAQMVEEVRAWLEQRGSAMLAEFERAVGRR